VKNQKNEQNGGSLQRVIKKKGKRQKTFRRQKDGSKVQVSRTLDTGEAAVRNSPNAVGKGQRYEVNEKKTGLEGYRNL